MVSYPSIYLDKYPKTRCLFSITCHISEGHSHTFLQIILLFLLNHSDVELVSQLGMPVR